MSTIVIRNRKLNGLLSLSVEARQRAAKHLKSVGIDVERFPRLIWPDDAVSAYQKHRLAPWQYTTRKDLRLHRQKNAKHVLWVKRECGVTKRQPLYVWVFWCPAVFIGWHTYLIGKNVSYLIGKNVSYSPTVRNNDKATIAKLLELFPLVDPMLFGEPDWDKWMAEFVKRYPRGRRHGKPYGKAPVWAEVDGSNIKRIVSRAEWPEVCREQVYPK